MRDHEARGKCESTYRATSSCPEKSTSSTRRRYFARVHNITNTQYGIRWALDVETQSGKAFRKKYSHFKESASGWAQFQREMRRIGVHVDHGMDRQDAVDLVKQTCMGLRVVVDIERVQDGLNIIFVFRA